MEIIDGKKSANKILDKQVEGISKDINKRIIDSMIKSGKIK